MIHHRPDSEITDHLDAIERSATRAIRAVGGILSLGVLAGFLAIIHSCAP
ncbi:MAG: hypothetical protein QM680_13640 [Luteolibacter sp.]